VVVAAERCFVERSYSSTTIAGIAEASGVSTETVYAIFKNKRAVLQAVIEAAVTGSVDGGELIGDDLLTRMRAEPEQRRRFALVTEATRGLLARTAPIDAVVRAAAAADPEIAAMQREHDRQTLKDVRRIVASLAEAGPLRMSESDAADRMWALVQHSDLYRTLTTSRRWSHARAFDALGDTIARMLLDD
jgi:AcrR family transcriptional regulator